MNSRKLMAVVLVTLGIAVLAYSGVSRRTNGNSIAIGPVYAGTTQSHFIPPVIGAVALVGGILLLVVGSKSV